MAFAGVEFHAVEEFAEFFAAGGGGGAFHLVGLRAGGEGVAGEEGVGEELGLAGEVEEA